MTSENSMADEDYWRRPYAPQQPQGYPQYSQYSPYAPAAKHSGLGIASFVIAIIVGVIELETIVIAAVIGMNAGAKGIADDSPEAMGIGLGAFCGLALAVLGGILGLIGCFQPNRRKVFAILGLLFNAAILVLVVALVIIGHAMN